MNATDSPLISRRAWLQGALASLSLLVVRPASAAPAPDAARWRGVGSAATLTGVNRLLFVFVSDAGATPWTTAMRNPVLWKIDAALRWLEHEAAARGTDLRMQHGCLPRDEAALAEALPIDDKDYRGGPHHATWQDAVATRLSGRSLDAGWDDLFRLADLPLQPGDGSAVMFVVRRYVPSVAFPYAEGDPPAFRHERGIIYDNGGLHMQRFLDSLIAHEIMHLYGAVDLAPGKTPPSLEPYRAHLDRDDIMDTPTQHPLSAYGVSDLTAWLVGWRDVPPAWLPQTSP